MVAIVLHAYNEEKSLPNVIDQIRIQAKKHLAEGIKIIVVDDGSSDNTSKYLQSLIWKRSIAGTASNKPWSR